MSLAPPAFNWIYLEPNHYTAACCCSGCGNRSLLIAGSTRNGVMGYRQQCDAGDTFSSHIYPEFYGDRFKSTCCRGSLQSVSRPHVATPSVPASPSSAALGFSIDEILRSDFGRHSGNDHRRRPGVTSSSQSDQRGTSGQQNVAERLG